MASRKDTAPNIDSVIENLVEVRNKEFDDPVAIITLAQLVIYKQQACYMEAIKKFKIMEHVPDKVYDDFDTAYIKACETEKVPIKA